MAQINRIEIRIGTEFDVFNARISGKKMAKQIGFSEIAIAEIEIAISELGTNIVKHANKRGIIVLQSVAEGITKGMEIISKDFGPGMNPIIRDGESTVGTLGIGLSGVKRIMDEFEMETGASGSTIKARKWILEDFPAPFHWSAINKPKIGESLSGDVFFYKKLPGYSVFSIIDVLGHGIGAHRVAEKSLRLIENSYREPLTTIIERCHEGLKGTRGAAMAIGKIHFHTRKFEHISVGNVETRIYGTTYEQNLSCTNGTLGMTMDHLHVEQHPYVKGACIIMFTDGISGKFSLDSSRLEMKAQEISNYIVKNFARNYDDATVLVIK